MSATHPSRAHRPRIVVVATGGTIASEGSTPTQTVGYARPALGADALVGAVPSLATLADVRTEQLFQVLSGHLSSANWLALARRVNALLALDDVDGVVVTHGTDALEETATWLTLTVRSVKPVVRTGAMRPASALSADGPMNLFNAVALAASRAATGMGVLVTLNDAIHAGRDVAKLRTASPDAFDSPEDVREYVAHTEPSRPRADEAYARPAAEFLKDRDKPGQGRTRRTLVDLQVTTVFPNGLASRFHQIVFQPLTSTYRVTFDGGLSQNYTTRAEAFTAISRSVRWKIAEAAQIEEGSRHYVEFSFRLDTSQLPRPMQIGIGGQADWAMSVQRTQKIN